MKNKTVFLLRIEPASYILALVKALRETWDGDIVTRFIASSLTQDWAAKIDEPGAALLPADENAAYREIKRTFSVSPPDLVHTAGWGQPICWKSIKLAEKKSVPTVVDLDTWQDAARGVRAEIKKVVLPMRLRKITHFAAGGSRQAAFLQRYGVPLSKITKVNMTVDTLAIQTYLETHPNCGTTFRRKHNISLDAKVFLYLGRLAPSKGIEKLLDAWPIISGREPKAQLVIVGDGPLLNVAKSRNLERVSYLGRLSGDEVWQAYAAANCFLAPSQREAWGLTINEAMAAGLPIIMTDAFGCIGDLAVNQETAIIVDAADENALAAAALEVVSSDALAALLSQGALRRISDWTIEHEAQNIVSIWTELLSAEQGIRP
ncbi:MAG: glycosyltransferase family 4 protein [Pseudomonadota bacterium]